MLKKFIVLSILIVVLASCKEDSTDPKESPLLGTWTITTMKYNGTEVNPDNYSKVPVKILFSYTGKGTVWYETLGKSTGSAEFSWSSDGSSVTTQVTGESSKIVSYSVSGSQLTISDSENYQYVYNKQN